MNREEREEFMTITGGYYVRVRGLCRLMTGDHEEAEDLTQETYARAWQSRAALREPDKARAWLFRIAVNLCRDRRRRDLVSLQDWDGAANDNGRDPIAERSVQAAIARLPSEYRQALLLSWVHELGPREAAAIVGVPEGTIKSRTSRAIGALQEMLAAA